jgi:hypothetical protein
MTNNKGKLMMRSLWCVVMLSLAVLLPIEAQSKQPKPGEETYVLTLRPEAAAMDDGAAAQLAATYGGELVASEEPGNAGYTVRISGSRARLLASDARVASLAPGRGVPRRPPGARRSRTSTTAPATSGRRAATPSRTTRSTASGSRR